MENNDLLYFWSYCLFCECIQRTQAPLKRITEHGRHSLECQPCLCSDSYACLPCLENRLSGLKSNLTSAMSGISLIKGTFHLSKLVRADMHFVKHSFGSFRWGAEAVTLGVAVGSGS